MGRRDNGEGDAEGIRIKRDVLRRVVCDKLEALLRGDFYVSRHLGQECYEPIVREVNDFSNNGDASGQPQAASSSEELDTFIQIIAASIMIDGTMRGENSGESEPRIIKKKKKLLAKTLKGPKREDFYREIIRFDHKRRGIADESEESLKSADNGKANKSPHSDSSSEDDGHESNLSDTSGTSLSRSGAEDGFSTSAASSRHLKKKLKKEKKRRKKEKKRERKERREKRRREKERAKAEKERHKEEKERLKSKKRHRKHDHDDDHDDQSQEHDADVPEAEVVADDAEEAEVDTQEGEEQGEELGRTVSYWEQTTKEEFEKFRDELLSKVPKKVKSRFREGGFSKWGKDMLPILELGPFDVEPGPVRDMWMEMFNNTRQSGRDMTRLVFWYGVKFEDRGQAYSFVPANKIVSYEDGESQGYCQMPKKIKKKIENKSRLSKTEEQIMRGLTEIKGDMKLEKDERIKWMMKFQEDYELINQEEAEPEPIPEPEPVKEAVEEEIKPPPKKRGRPRKVDKERAEREKAEREKAEREKAQKSAKEKGLPSTPKTEADDPSAATKVKSEKSTQKVKSEKPKKKQNKKFIIVDEDEDEADIETDEDKDDQSYNDESSDEMGDVEEDEKKKEVEAPVEKPTKPKGKPGRKRKADTEEKKPKKKVKAEQVGEEEMQDDLDDHQKKDADWREKKRKEKAEALGLDYIPVESAKKKSKKKLWEEEQIRFSKCEDVFLPIMDQLEEAKESLNVKVVLKCVHTLIEQVETLTPSFLHSYRLGMLVKDVRKSFESTDRDVKDQCKRLTNEMKRVYSERESNYLDDFIPKKRDRVKTKGVDSQEGKRQLKLEEPTQTTKLEDEVQPNLVSSRMEKSVDLKPQRNGESYSDFTPHKPSSAQSSEVVTQSSNLGSSEPATQMSLEIPRSKMSVPIKIEPPKPSRQVFSIKGMFEKPKPSPKPKSAPATTASGQLSPKPRALPSWVTGPAPKMEEFHEQHAENRNFALEFLNDATSTINCDKADPVSIARAFELAIFSETKLRGREWKQYWEKVHDVVYMLSPGRNKPNGIVLGILGGDYQDPSELVKVSRRDIQNLNQRRIKS